MKYLIFSSVLLILVPASAVVASLFRRIREVVFVLFLASTAFIDRYDINFLYRGWYESPTRGLEISFVDLLALILLISTLAAMRREGHRMYWPAGLGVMLAYFLYGATTVLIFEPKIFGLLELFKLLRGLLAYVAVALYVRDKRDTIVLVFVIGAVLLYEGFLAVLQRYFVGTVRVQGTFMHPSMLADYCSVLAPILLSVSLARLRLVAQMAGAAAWALACAATILTITRMGIAALLTASSGVFLIGIAKRPDSRTIAVAFVCFVIAVGLVVRGFDMAYERHKTMVAGEEAGDDSAGRKFYYVQAWRMASEYPFGVGLNNYCHRVSLDEGGTYGKGGLAHSAFCLTLGNLGWPGLIIFLGLWGRFLWISGRALFAKKNDFLTCLSTGCFFGILAAFLAALTEHNFWSQNFYVVFNVVLGLTSALRQIQRCQTELPV